MADDQKRKAAKKEARRLIRRARSTAKLKDLESLRDDGAFLYHRNGVIYQDIGDDLADMKTALENVGLMPDCIGVKPDEISQLQGEANRLNAPHRARMGASKHDPFDYLD